MPVRAVLGTHSTSTAHSAMPSARFKSYEGLNTLDVLNLVRHNANGHRLQFQHLFGQVLSKPLAEADEKVATHLCATQEECNSLNDARLKELQGDEHTFTPCASSQDEDSTTSNNKGGVRWIEDLEEQDFLTKTSGTRIITLRLKVGLRVIFLRNEPQGKLRNGSLGTVTGFVKTSSSRPLYALAGTSNSSVNSPAQAYEWLPKVTWRDPRTNETFQGIVVPQELADLGDGSCPVWGLPLLGAEALTIHRSLGLTLQAVILHCEGIFEDHQFYEGISRTPSFEHLQVLNFTYEKIMVSEEAARVMLQLEKMASMPPESMPDMDVSNIVIP